MLLEGGRGPGPPAGPGVRNRERGARPGGGAQCTSRGIAPAAGVKGINQTE